MSMLKNLESKIAGLVEGAFGRAFRSEVRPVEIARKLAREMDANRAHSLSRVFAPNRYGVFLSPKDRALLEPYESELAVELSGYLLEHARRERVELLTRPVIEFHTDERLGLGEFGIQARLVRPEQRPDGEERVSEGERGHTMIYGKVESPPQTAATGQRRASIGSPVLVIDGRRVLVGQTGAVIGRSRECDVVLNDANVSRRHAELRPSAEGWVVRDLGSTNGVRLNGDKIGGAHVVRRGDQIELGTASLLFELQ